MKEQKILLFEAVERPNGKFYLRVRKEFADDSMSWGMSQSFWEMIAWEFEKISKSSDSDGGQQIEAIRIIKWIRAGLETMKEEKASQK